MDLNTLVTAGVVVNVAAIVFASGVLVTTVRSNSRKVEEHEQQLHKHGNLIARIMGYLGLD